MDVRSRDVRRFPPVLLLAVFLVVTAGILSAGYLYYRNYRENFKRGVEQTLLAIADLKASELIDWRAERLADAAVFFENSTFLGLTRRALAAPAALEAREQLLAWLRSVEQAYQYDRLFILDAQGVERLSTRDVPGPLAAYFRDQVTEVLRSGQVSFLDFHRDAPDLPIHLSILVPLFAAGPPPRPLGVLVLKIDPRTYLFPYIARWPTPSRTAETLLVRREGGEVVFLNELRFRKGTALALRSPLSDATLPAAQAALGREGIMEGRDYRGVPVVAALSKVPGSPWSLVARMDVSEAYAPLQERLLEVALIVGALLLGAAAGVGLAWRQQSAKFYRSRYEMSEALRAVSLRQEALLAAVPDIIMEVNASKVYTWANLAGREFFGEDVLGKEAAVFFEGEQSIYESVKPLFEGREDVLYVESLQRRKDGEKRLLAWWCRVLKDDRGRVTGALSSARDITEQKRSQEALNASEIRYRRLFEAAKDGILILNADTGTILDVNPFLIEMLGFSHDEFLGKRIWDLGFFGDIVDSQARFEELQRKEYVRYENLPLERADGRRLEVEFVSNVYKVSGQKVIQCNIRDITDRKRAEDALAVQKRIGDIFLTRTGDEMFYEVLRVVLEVLKSPYGVFGYLDEEGALVVPSMTAHVWDKCEVPDKSIVFPRETWGDSSWPRAVKELKPNFSNEGSTKTPEGHVRLTRHISLPILFQGAAIGLFQVANKETPYTGDDIHQLEAIAAYVAPVLSARLQRQRQEAELQAKNDELIRFTYTVSHDLKSPLVTIRTFLGYLEQDARRPDPAAIEKDLGYIRNSADKMSQLLDELLELSRIGRRVNPSVEVTLQEVVQEALDLVAGRISGRGVEVKVTQEPVRLWGDRVRLVEIFQNLIDNAVKFMGDERDPRIEIGAEPEGDGTALFVRDNGMGIDLRHQPKLFNLFEKLDANSEGSGIGLVLIKRIVEVHGGKIRVESPGPGQGTTFRFTLAKTKRPPREKEVK